MTKPQNKVGAEKVLKNNNDIIEDEVNQIKNAYYVDGKNVMIRFHPVFKYP